MSESRANEPAALPSLPPKVPAAELPRDGASASLESLEENTLDKQAKSASYRDDHERQQHLDTLNRRIDVLQKKLDSREAELHAVLPRLARFEQSAKISKAVSRDGAIALAIGGMLVSAAGLFSEGTVRMALSCLGGGIFIAGMWASKLLNFNVWPADPGD